MRRLRLAAFALWCGAATALLAAEPRAGAEKLSSADRARIDALFASYTPATPGCAMGVMRNGQLAYARGYGMADLERGAPITPATLFDVGSTSKQFTAAAIVLLALDGKLSLADDVRKYLPELPDYGTPISIDELLRHTSGLRDYIELLSLAGVEFDEVATDAQTLEIIARQQQLNFPSGTRHEYSNTGYFLLSLIVQRVSGKPLQQFAAERIFRPLGMTHTMIRGDHAMLVPGRALGYAPGEKTGFKLSMSNWEQTGDGSVQVSIEDMLKWDENFYHPRLGGPAFVELMEQPGKLTDGTPIHYARGLFVDTYRGLRRVQHGGSWIGYKAAFARFAEAHTSIAVFCNNDAINPMDMLQRITDIVLAASFKEAGPAAPLPPPPPKPAAFLGANAGDLPAFIGQYYSAELDISWSVILHAGKLAIERPTRKFASSIEPLEATAPDEFNGGEAGTLHFSRDTAGHVRGFELSTPRVHGIRFEMLKAAAKT